MERYLNLSLPFGLVPTEATIGSYRQKPSARALHRYETGGEPWPVSAASSHQLSPHWHKASGSESQENMLHSVAEAGRGGENWLGSRKCIGISSLACCEMWVKMRLSPFGTQFVFIPMCHTFTSCRACACSQRIPSACVRIPMRERRW